MDKGFRRVRVGKALVTSGGDLMAGQEIFGEGFGTFQLRRRLSRPEATQASGGETVDDPQPSGASGPTIVRSM